MLRIGLKTKSTIGLITAKATTTPTATPIAALIRRLRNSSRCSRTESLNRGSPSGPSPPNLPTVNANLGLRLLFYPSTSLRAGSSTGLAAGAVRKRVDACQRERRDVVRQGRGVVRPQ